MTIATCQHHWRIATPQGEYSEGTCKRCKATRMFRNWAPDGHVMYSKQNGGTNKLTPGQASFGHQSIRQNKPEGVAGKDGRIS